MLVESGYFRKKFVLTFIMIFLFGIFVPVQADEMNNEKEIAIFLVPHQDDEVVSFGIAILDRLSSME